MNLCIVYRQSFSAGWSWEWFATVGTLKQQAMTSSSMTLATSVQSGALLSPQVSFSGW